MTDTLGDGVPWSGHSEPLALAVNLDDVALRRVYFLNQI
jgi:hypothetical protein